ncbi:MAG: hypothetical protein ACLGG7_11435, partial [Bacteriovoracia bacterium]
MKTLLLLTLALVAGCQPLGQLQETVRGFFGARPAEPEASAEYTPTPPPALEADKVVQLSPKEKVLTLIEQFNRSPEDVVAGLIINELTQNRSIFPASEDAALKNVLNRLVPWVQQGQPQTLSLLLQLAPLLLGENKELVRAIVSRGFDSDPVFLITLLLKRGEDKLCYLSSLVPPEISPDNKLNFLLSRREQFLELKLDTSLTAAQLSFLETCIRTIELTTTPA